MANTNRTSSIVLHVKAVWWFYKKILVPALVLSPVVGFIAVATGQATFDQINLSSVIGYAYIFLSVLLLYLIYEVRNPNEYYFYYNLGLSKILLWAVSLIISIPIGLLLGVAAGYLE